ncbi:MAG: DUF2066 domain-containing protein [Marinobacter sp.]|nr:DUF2066 domain-containing protein [Marinobacter sp.]
MSLSGRISTRAARLFRHILPLAGALALLAVFPVGAATVSGLYTVEVPVAGGQPGQLRQGYADGLEKVLIRVSGNSNIRGQAGVQSLLEDAESLLQSYQLLRGEGGDRLRMSFGAVGVNRALASVDAPVWGANRPLTLAWIAVEEQGSRALLTSDAGADSAGSPWSMAFRQAAADRGLPINLPPASMAGNRELLSDIWGQFTNRVKSASGALDHDLMALVRVSRSGNQWRAGWIFDGMGMDEGEQSVTAGSERALAEKVIDRWADAFASRYAVAAGDVGDLPKVEIIVQGVSTLQDYGNIIRVLDNLTPVQDVGASRVAGDQLTLRVAFSGELEQLREYIALDTRFVPLSSAEAVNNEPAAQSSPEQSPEEPPVGAVQESPDAMSDPLYAYQPLLSGSEEAEETFESLYEILHYRWQPASVISTDDAE